MSGHKVVPILDANKDVFLHGGPVRRLKPSPSSKSQESDLSTEIVVASACTMKLLQRTRPAVPRSAAKSADSAQGQHVSASSLSTEDAVKEPPPPLPKPMLVWRQQHCFIKDIAPLRNPYASDSTSANYGFAMYFFSMKRAPKDPKKITPLHREALDQCKCLDGSVMDASQPQLRVREYACSSEYEQEDWVGVFRMALTNYWHERLESVVVSSPEVFQWQTFCFELAPGSTPKAALSQSVLSTAKIYVVPRHDQQHIEKDSSKFKSCPVASLTRVGIRKDIGVVDVIGGTFSVSLGFFPPREAVTFVLELQRIWELVTKDEPFPYEVNGS